MNLSLDSNTVFIYAYACQSIVQKLQKICILF